MSCLVSHLTVLLLNRLGSVMLESLEGVSPWVTSPWGGHTLMSCLVSHLTVLLLNRLGSVMLESLEGVSPWVDSMPLSCEPLESVLLMPSMLSDFCAKRDEHK